MGQGCAKNSQEQEVGPEAPLVLHVYRFEGRMTTLSP